jgi:hypothetical protein
MNICIFAIKKQPWTKQQQCGLHRRLPKYIIVSRKRLGLYRTLNRKKGTEKHGKTPKDTERSGKAQKNAKKNNFRKNTDETEVLSRQAKKYKFVVLEQKITRE